MKNIKNQSKIILNAQFFKGLFFFIKKIQKKIRDIAQNLPDLANKKRKRLSFCLHFFIFGCIIIKDKAEIVRVLSFINIYLFLGGK